MENKIDLCKTCTNRKFEISEGIVCGITSKKPDFINSCANYNKDDSVKYINYEETDSVYPADSFDENTLLRLQEEQSFPLALITGFAAAMIGAALWATITVITKYQIGFMAMGVGALVGFTIRYFGKGIDTSFGVAGAAFALMGCVFGNLFSIVGFASIEYNLDFFETLASIDIESINSIMIESFSFMDIVFYGLAVYEGYKFSFRTFKTEELEALKQKVT